MLLMVGTICALVSEEINRKKHGIPLPWTRSLASSPRGRPPTGGAIPGFSGKRYEKVRKESEIAGSPKPTCLSLQSAEMQGAFAKLQGQRRLIQQKALASQWVDRSLPNSRSRENIIPQQGRSI
jgi:hypothetical protein